MWIVGNTSGTRNMSTPVATEQSRRSRGFTVNFLIRETVTTRHRGDNAIVVCASCLCTENAVNRVERSMSRPIRASTTRRGPDQSEVARLCVATPVASHSRA